MSGSTPPGVPPPRRSGGARANRRRVARARGAPRGVRRQSVDPQRGARPDRSRIEDRGSRVESSAQPRGHERARCGARPGWVFAGRVWHVSTGWPPDRASRITAPARWSPETAPSRDHHAPPPRSAGVTCSVSQAARPGGERDEETSPMSPGPTAGLLSPAIGDRTLQRPMPYQERKPRQSIFFAGFRSFGVGFNGDDGELAKPDGVGGSGLVVIANNKAGISGL